MQFNAKKSLSLVVTLVIAAAAFAGQAQALVKDVVRDARGVVVRDTNGGCVLTKWDVNGVECSSTILSVYFGFDKSTLSSESKSKLDQLADQFMNESANLYVVGFADRIGNADYNYRLSLKRANRVKDYLLSRGLRNVGDVSVEGLGETESVTDCKNGNKGNLVECLWEDRRVDIRLGN